MRRALPLSVLGAALVLFAVVAPRGPLEVRPVTAISNCDTATAALDAAELRMLELVNNARAAEGRVALVPSPSLNRAAAWKSEDSARTGLSHTDSLGRGPFQRMPDCGYPNSGLGENVGTGRATTDAMFDAFMASSGHRAAILLANARAIGLGHAGGHWTMNFGSIDDSGAPVPPGPTATPTPKPTAKPTVQPIVSPKKAVIVMVSFE
jgi:uncharacterized protein YkwD